MKPIFTSEDFFDEERGLFLDIHDAAEIANRKIKSLLGPKVYGNVDSISEIYDTKPGKYDTHTAYLFNVTELPNKECSHEPRVFEGWYSGENIECMYCGTELVPKWEAKP